MIHVGLDLSRRRVDVVVMNPEGGVLEVTSALPDSGGLADLDSRMGAYSPPVLGVVESMNGARFIHDRLEELGWGVEIADAQRVKGLASLVAKTDRGDAWVLAELSRRDLVPAIWLPTPAVREERERIRFRMRLVAHRTGLKNRIHATLAAFGKPCPVSDLFGVEGRRLLARLGLPHPWRGNIEASLRLIDYLDAEIDQCERELRRLGADHRYVPLLCTIPGVSWILGYAIASEIGDINRFASPKKLVGYSGLSPRVIQSGENDWRGPVAKNGPRYLRWALIEATTWAARHPAYEPVDRRIRQRLGGKRGAQVARVEIARRLCEAIWWMLTRNQPFRPFVPQGPTINVLAS